MKKYLLPLLFAVITAQAQTPQFVQHFNGFTLSGIENSSMGTMNFGQGSAGVIIQHQNFNSDILWSKSYRFTSNEMVTDIAKTSVGDYVICGKTAVSGGYQPFVFSIAENGNVLWSRVFTNIGGDDVHIEIRQDGTLMLAAAYGYGIAVAHLSASGDVLESSALYYGVAPFEFMVKSFPNDDLLVMSRHPNISSPLAGPANMIKLSADLNSILWSKTVSGICPDNEGVLILDSVIVLAASYDSVLSLGGPIIMQSSLMRFDHSGNLLNDIRLPEAIPNQSQFYSVRSSGENLLVAGYDESGATLQWYDHSLNLLAGKKYLRGDLSGTTYDFRWFREMTDGALRLIIGNHTDLIQTDSTGNTTCFDTTDAPAGSPGAVVQSPSMYSLDTITIGSVTAPVIVNTIGYDATVFCSNVTGVEEVTSGSINIYPNPFSDQLNITVDGAQDWSFSIYDLQGRSVLAGNSAKSSAAVDVSFLPAGMYVLNIQRAESMIIRKLIKM
jgi:hypothetical protein